MTAADIPMTQEAGVPDERQGERGLVYAARKGNRAAFAQLHARYAPLVHGILLSRVPVQEANDLVQDVFLRALDRIGDLRDPDAFGPWLAAIARRFSVRFHRQRRGVNELPADLATDPSHDPSHGAVTGEARAALAAIRGLPDAYRETLILRLVEGLTGPQIAAHTGLAPGSVRVNLHRGMKLLRARLRPDGIPEDLR
ncbi:MAG: RNA polymerase sigma factor [Planctomycetota bacterium]